MKKTFVLALALPFCLALAGCTDADWDHALSYTGLSDTSAEPAVEQPAAAAAAPADETPVATTAPAGAGNLDFCRAVATRDATSNGFDELTQKRIYARSLGQCVAIFNR